MSVVAAIEPSLRQAEIERVKRKWPDNLDAYDLVLRAIPPATPDRARVALSLLESALGLEPDYATAHGFAAFCHGSCAAVHSKRTEARPFAMRTTAIRYGRDDAIALAIAGFVTGIVGHDIEAAFEAAKALSQSSAITYVLAAS
jgi:hypothetical protein